jgi:hypothetical protein
MERIGAADRPQFKTLSLHLNEPQTLLSAASTLGYRAVAEPGLASHGDAAPLLLERSDGSRLAITRNEAGRLDIHTSADQGLLHSLMRQHTESAVSQHLARGGMKFETARLANGEMQILAREPTGASAEARRRSGPRFGPTAPSGSISTAAGATAVTRSFRRSHRRRAVLVTGSAKKEAWFQLPGEPTRTRVKT